MSIVNRILQPFAPGIVVKRLASQQLIKAYEAANRTRLHKAEREAKSADLAVEMAGRSLREQARWLDENHDLVIGLFDRLEERVIGGKGIGIEPLPLDLDGNVLTELSAQIKRRWAEWSLAPETSGELTRPQMERLVCRSWLRDGEVLAQQVQGTVPGYQYLTDTPFALEVLEADYLPLDYSDPKKGIVQGIERNAWRRVRAYHLYKQHPGDLKSFWQDTKRVEAESIIHLAHRKRLQQSRGVTLIHGVIRRLADLKDYEESERVAARISAALAMYIRKGTPDMFIPGDSEEGGRSIPIAPGMTFDGLMPGEEVGMIESNRPNPMLEGFRDAMLRAVAAGSRSAYSTLARNYNGTYSAQRQELVEAQLGYDLLQHEFIDGWSRKVYRRWLSIELLTGAITLPKELNKSTLNNAVYLGPVMPWINPVHEANAWETLVKAGFADEAEVARGRGRDPQELKSSRIAEIKRNRDEGLVFSSDAAHTVKNPTEQDGTPTKTQGEEDE